jgi:hypothetical protein
MRPIPATMKAAAIDRFGPPSVLKLHTLAVPEPGPGDVLIAVHALISGASTRLPSLEHPSLRSGGRTTDGRHNRT